MISYRLKVMAVVCALGAHGCMEPPPKIPTVPASGLALRLYVFGASAVEANKTFASVKQNNPTFSLVRSGGNGEVLIGLENDSPRCVAPTAMCSYRVSYRIRDNNGAVLDAKTTTIDATSDSCSDLCAKALTNIAVKIVEVASSELGGAATTLTNASTEDAGTPSATTDAGAPPIAVRPKKTANAGTKVEPPICSAAHGPRLPSQEAERRAAQVEVLKRLEIVDQDEYDCLRKAYLDRL